MRIEPRPGVEVIKKPSDILVTQNDIDRYKRLKGPQNVLNGTYGEGNWGDQEVKRYIQETKFAKHSEESAHEKIEAVGERLRRYLETFDAVTPNDVEMLRAMAHIEVNLEAIRQQLAETDDPSDIKKLADTQTKLLTEHRQLQQILGIDKAGREKGKRAKSAFDEIQDLVAEGARFIDEQLVKISHCGILIGWVHPHFPEMGYEFKTKCPKCGEEVQICTSATELASYSTDAK